jgi:hypothetical protein
VRHTSNKLGRLIATLALLLGISFAQQPVNTTQVTLPLSVGAPQPPTQAGPPANLGAGGSATYYYWLVSEFAVGNSAVSGPYVAYNAPNTLSSGNSVFLSWATVPGAASYDVLRTLTPIAPGGACNCAVTVATTSTSVTDQSPSLSSYTVASFQPQNFQLSLANEATGAGATHLILRRQPSGQQIADLSVSTSGLTSTGGTGIVVQTGPSTTRVATASDVIGLWSACSGTQYLGADGNCHTGGTGTVTSIATSTGLTGGPITGSGTLALVSSYQLPQACSTNQIPQWNGTTWTCANAGAGSVTNIASGTGLTGGPITSTGTLAIVASYQLPQSCSTNQLPQWNGTGWSCTNAGTGTITGATGSGGLQATGTTLGLLNSCSNSQVLQWNGSAWICANVGSLPSGTQYYPAINSNGSTGYQTSPQSVDATLAPGADMCLQIVAARQSSSCGSNVKGCYIRAPFNGVQNCSVDPFSNGGSGAAWVNGGILDFRGAKNLDVRIAKTWNIPGNVHVIGPGTTSSGGAANINNMIVRAGNAAWQLGATNFTVAHEAITGGISITGTTATVTVNNTMCVGSNPNSGQDVFIYGGPSFFAAYHGLALAITGCSGGTATSFQVQVPSGTAGCSTTCSGATVYEGTPMINMGSNAPSAAQYRTQIEGMSIDAAWVLGAIPLTNFGAEENSWFKNVNFFNFGGEAFRLSEFFTAGLGGGGSSGGGASQSGPYSDFSINFLAETCELTTNSGCNTTSTGVGTGQPLYETSGISVNPQSQNPLNCQTLGFLVDGPRSSGGTTTVNHLGGIYSFTLSANDPDPSSTNPNQTPVAMRAATCGTPYSGGATPIGFVIYGVSTALSDTHVEYWPTPFEVGGNAALNATFPGTNLSNTTITTSGVSLRTLNALVNGTGNTSYAIDVGPHATDVNVEGINTFNNGSVLKDNVTSNGTCSDVTLGFYHLGAGSPPALDSSCGGGVHNTANLNVNGTPVVLTAPAQSQTTTIDGSGNLKNAYAGVNVNPQTTDYSAACPTDRLGEIEFNISSAKGFYLPQAGSTPCNGSNNAMVARNASTSTAILTICIGTGTSGSCTPGSSTFLPEGTTSINLVPGAAEFIYSDATTGTGNYHAIPVATPFGGVNVQTSNYTASLLDKDKLIVMNCSGACALTLPATPPSSKWNIWAMSIGSTLATVSVSSLTFNGGASAPAFIKYMPLMIRTDGSNYFGDAPLVAGTNITLTPAANGVTVASSGGGGGGAPGGVTILKKTATYAGASGDYSSSSAAPTQVIFTLTATAQTYTLLSTAPATGSCVIVENSLASLPYNLGLVTGGSTTLDGTAYATAATTLQLAPGQSTEICSDGTNYFSQNGRTNAIVTTSNLGGFIGGISASSPNIGAGTAAVAANAAYTARFELSGTHLVSNFTFNISTLDVGGHCDFGIYAVPASGADVLLVHSGPQVTTTAVLVTGAVTTPTTLPPGVYDFAWSCDNATVILYGFLSLPGANTNTLAIMNQKQPMLGFVSGAYSSGLPATLTVTGSSFGNSQNIPMVMFTP